ncbi:hypothetical protein HanPI659440_Chr17g0667081 [Helianthus annuus]|nr:hypothetical protein HanPI659440_Chr17g0667081 [Helianthus annuus]
MIGGGSKAEKIIYALAIISCWCIWKERNEVVFNQKKCCPHDIIGQIKSRGYPCNYLNWADWCKYPLYML